MKPYKHKYTDNETEPDYPLTLRCFNCFKRETVSGEEAEYHNITNENFLCQECNGYDPADDSPGGHPAI